jgi:hypothetical protein
LTEAGTYQQGIYKNQLVRKIALWLDAQPHPPIAIEIAPDRISGARFTRTRSLRPRLKPTSLTWQPSVQQWKESVAACTPKMKMPPYYFRIQ